MPDEDKRRKQRTPTGAVIPVPTRKEVMRDLQKVAKPPKAEQDSDDEDQQTER